MTEPSAPMEPVITERERRWLNALLILGTFAVGLILLGLLANVFILFSDILLIFFLAWLLAFVISPSVTRIVSDFPKLPRGLVVLFTYTLLLVAMLLVTLVVAQALATSIGNFVTSLPTLQERLPEILAPTQAWLRSLGLQVDLLAGARSLLAGLGSVGADLVRPLSEIALASLGAIGNVVLIVILSLFMVIDGDRIVAFITRLTPQRYQDELEFLQQAVASSFGGFLRGQAIVGLLYGVTAALVHLVLGMDYMAASATAAGVLMAIPFFGPIVCWTPPVLVALLTKQDVFVPTLLVMVVSSFVLLNVVQPRLMARAVGVHPIVVLASLLLGLKLAGIAGAIFGIPIAAVVSNFFFYYLNRNSGPRDVASRAARRLQKREGRPIRVPREPAPAPVPPRPREPSGGGGSTAGTAGGIASTAGGVAPSVPGAATTSTETPAG